MVGQAQAALVDTQASVDGQVHQASLDTQASVDGQAPAVSLVTPVHQALAVTRVRPELLVGQVLQV